MSITKEDFERVVPAFKSAGEELFNICLSYYKPFLVDILIKIGEIGLTRTEREQYMPTIDEVIILQAAYEMIPLIDLVATPSGFAVTRNDNLAPASKERVEAFRKQIFIQYQIAKDRLFDNLRDKRFGRTPAGIAIFYSLIYSYTSCRKAGVADEHLLKSESELKTMIQRAHIYVTRIISPEVMAHLLEYAIRQIIHIRNGWESRIAPICQFMARYINRWNSSTPLTPLELKERKAQQVMEDQDLLAYAKKEIFPEMRYYELNDTATTRAHALQPYQNRKDDSTFFFG